MELHSFHKPVMLDEMLKYLSPTDDKTYVDCTFGAGGYSRSILNHANCNLISIDRDPDVVKFANEINNSRFKFRLARFSEIKSVLDANNISKVDGIVLDLGVSSMQLDERNRGFSFMSNDILDMRMSRDGVDAKYFINNLSEEELADIIYYFGDERDARKIARKICIQRIDKEITTTKELSGIVNSVKSKRFSKIDHSTKTFQAIRIYVNQELDELRLLLGIAEELLNVNGRLVVISFHSLEDRIVKEFVNRKIGKTEGISRYVPKMEDHSKANFISLTRGAINPTKEEIELNIRSRSAKLRAIEKIGDVS